MSKADDERTKLTATFMNGVAITMVAAGSIAPLVAYSYGMPGSSTGAFVALRGVAWLVGGIALHLFARWILRGIR